MASQRECYTVWLLVCFDVAWYTVLGGLDLSAAAATCDVVNGAIVGWLMFYTAKLACSI